jgi:branched-chain amino acid transport system permease protein
VNYVLHVLILAAIYATLAISLDLVIGYTGILSVAHAAFFGVGAYTAAIGSTRYGASLPLCLFLAVTIAIACSFLLSVPSLRIRDDYFVIATFSFQIIVTSVLNNWMSVTRGPLGIPGIPQPTIFGLTVESQGSFLLLAGIACALVCLLLIGMALSPFGRVLRAIREDEVLAQALGKNVFRFKVVAFAVTAACAATAGVIYAYYIGFVDPTSFTVMDSILFISMVIIGGAGSIWGPAVGAFSLVLLPEALRFVGLPSYAAANVRQIAYGLILVIVVTVRPSGLFGRYEVGR